MYVRVATTVIDFRALWVLDLKFEELRKYCFTRTVGSSEITRNDKVKSETFGKWTWKIIIVKWIEWVEIVIVVDEIW